MARKLFCQICPLTYRISTYKERGARRIKDVLSGQRFARTRQEELLPVLIYKHSSLIRRRLGDVDMRLQETRRSTCPWPRPGSTQCSFGQGRPSLSSGW